MTGSKRVAGCCVRRLHLRVRYRRHPRAGPESLQERPLYNASISDFTPVALIAEVPIVLITRKDLPVNNLQEFVAYAKANQTKMQYGSAGAGSATHLGCVLLNYLIGVDYHARSLSRHGSCDAGPSRRSDRLPLRDRKHRQAPDRRRHRQGHRDHGREERSKVLPNVPTGIEQGVPNLEAYTWNAIFLPKGAPAEMG